MTPALPIKVETPPSAPLPDPQVLKAKLHQSKALKAASAAMKEETKYVLKHLSEENDLADEIGAYPYPLAKISRKDQVSPLDPPRETMIVPLPSLLAFPSKVQQQPKPIRNPILNLLNLHQQDQPEQSLMVFKAYLLDLDLYLYYLLHLHPHLSLRLLWVLL